MPFPQPWVLGKVKKKKHVSRPNLLKMFGYFASIIPQDHKTWPLGLTTFSKWEMRTEQLCHLREHFLEMHSFPPTPSTGTLIPLWEDPDPNAVYSVTVQVEEVLLNREVYTHSKFTGWCICIWHHQPFSYKSLWGKVVYKYHISEGDRALE